MKTKEVLRDWKQIASLLIIIPTITTLYNHTNDDVFVILNLVSWAALAFYTYRSIHRYVSSIIITNDKIFLASQITGGIIAITTATIGIMILLGGISIGEGLIPEGTTIMIFGLAILGVFTAFRTRRKHFSIFKKQTTKKP